MGVEDEVMEIQRKLVKIKSASGSVSIFFFITNFTCILVFAIPTNIRDPTETDV